MPTEHPPHDPNEIASEQPFVPAVDVAGLLNESAENPEASPEAPELSPEQKWGEDARAIGALLLKDARDVSGNQGPGPDKASYIFLPSADFGQVRIDDYNSRFACGFDPKDARGSRDTILRHGTGILSIDFKVGDTESNLMITKKSSIDPYAGFISSLLAQYGEGKRDDEVVAVLTTGSTVEPINPYTHPTATPLLEFVAAEARARTGEGA